MVLATLLVWLASSLGSPIALAAEQPAAPLPTIKVEDAKDVADVQALNDLLSALSRGMTACVDGGRPVESCRCRYPQELTNLRKGYDRFLRQHPAWKDQTLSYQYINKEGRNMSGVISIQTLRRQLESLKCE